MEGRPVGFFPYDKKRPKPFDFFIKSLYVTGAFLMTGG